MEKATLTFALIEQFIASAPYTDDPSEQEFRRRIGKALQSPASV
jgi:hypothetical protein